MTTINVSKLPPGWLVVPTGVTPRFIEFWERFTVLVKPAGTGYSRGTHPDNGVARNKATVEMMRRPEAQWIYYLDDDHEFTDTSLVEKVHLLEQRPDVDALAGFYTKKYPPYASVLFTKIPPDPLVRPDWRALAKAAQGDGLLRVAGCGGGGLLVRRRVMDRLYELHPDGHLWETGPKRAWGPDIGFCMKVRDAGFNMYADVARPLGHQIACTTTPQWEPKTKQWYIVFKFGQKSFRLPASSFSAETTEDTTEI